MKLLPYLLVLLSPTSAFTEEVRISVGMNRDAAIALIKKYGAKDITRGLAVVGPNGEHPLTGIYWAFQDYDAIITVATNRDRIVAMTFWNKKDFNQSKSHRAKTEREIAGLVLDTTERVVSTEREIAAAEKRTNEPKAEQTPEAIGQEE